MDAVSSTAGFADKVWVEAGERVAAYLRACRVGNPELRRRLVQRIITAAIEDSAMEPQRSPVELAAEETRRLVEVWANRFIPPMPDESPRHRFAHARAAVLLADLPRRWPDGFLNLDEVPREFEQQFQGTYLKAGPELNFSNMTPRPIDLGPVSSLANETWRTFDKWPVLRGVAVWGIFFAVLVIAFFAVRY